MGSAQSNNALTHSKRKPTTSAGFLGRNRKASVSSVVGDANIRSPSVIVKVLNVCLFFLVLNFIFLGPTAQKNYYDYGYSLLTQL